MSGFTQRGAAALSRSIVAILLAGALAVATVPGTLAASRVAPATTGSGAAAEAGFTLDLSTAGDFVAQTNFVQCVGASMQMMLNIIRPDDDRTAATQLQLQTVARALSPTRPDGRERKGASVVGWSAGLVDLEAGPYRLVGDVDLQTILRSAARSMRETGRPVGLLVWAGRHAWVLGGFTATADPLLTSDFEVTGAVIMDPLYPHGSRVWGPSPKPRQVLTIDELRRQLVPRRSSQGSNAWLSGFGGRYVIVMPWAPSTVRTVGGVLR